MGYSSIHNKKPFENASKTSHSHIINDSLVKEFLNDCELPITGEQAEIKETSLNNMEIPTSDPIQHIIAIDGGYTEIFVKKEFPSSQMAFFQFGALTFSVSDLLGISKMDFIDPDDMGRLKQIERFKLVLPTKNIRHKNGATFKESVRKSIDAFFRSNPEEESFLKTLKWFIYEEYDIPLENYTLSTCPNCEEKAITVSRNSFDVEYKTKCPCCNESIYLIDFFRLHEAIDNELGAGGILGYLTTLIEQIIIVHFIRTFLNIKPSLLSEILFIKDGPLAFFGQTANMHKSMRNLIRFLYRNHNLFLVGLEKSGAFVEHAGQVAEKIPPNSYLLLDNDYIYKYIMPGISDPNRPYAGTSYYSGKLIFKSAHGLLHVVTLPTDDPKIVLNPQKKDFKNIDVILQNLTRLKCDMYDNGLIPIALVNKLVSLANHPSAVLLEKFAKINIQQN